MSMRSDASSDCSDNFVLLQGENEQLDAMSLFRTKNRAEEVLELAVEVKEDDRFNKKKINKINILWV